MALICIPRNLSDALRKAAKSGDITIEKLENLGSSEARRKLLEKYIGKDAKDVNALFEKALVSNQKQAKKQWVWKNFYDGKPLYTELTLAQSQAMRNAGLSVKDLKNMSPQKRIDELSKYVSRKVAENLNKRFETLQKTGNLANWEERVIGTKKLFEDKKLKGAFARLETLDDLGYLNPKQSADFMEDLVSMKLGVDVTPQEATQISKLVQSVSESFDKVGDKWVHTNEEAIRAYFRNRKALEDFIERIDPAPVLSVFTDVGARGALLFSMRSLTNSFLFQMVPGVTRFLVKRLAAVTQLPGDYIKLQRVQNIMSGTWLSKTERQFIHKQAKMGFKIYRETGYDISRLQNLDDGFHFFGEKFTHVNGPTLAEARTVQDYLALGVRTHAKFMHGGLKYAAGGTDAVFANLHRADTTALLSKVVARNEAKAGKLPKGLTEAQRTRQLMEESYSFNPKSEEALYIREMGIQDAHYANGTQNEAYGVMALKIRDSLNIKGFKLGSILVPFLKIPANMLGTGLEATTGSGLILGSRQVIRGLKMAGRGAEKSTEIAKGLSKMIASSGILGGAIFLTSFLGEEDFVGAYDWKKRSENKLTQTKNAGSNYIRMGGKWYSTRWLGPMAIPVNAIMHARQAKARGKNQAVGYVTGVLWGALDFPGLVDVGKQVDKMRRAAEADDLTEVLAGMNMDLESSQKFWVSRTLPSFITYDVMGLRNETRYDALGRPIPKRGDSVQNAITMSFIGANVKQDTSNAITREFDKLLNSGNLPVLTDPSSAKEEEGIERYGEEGYHARLNRLKKDYAREVEQLIRQQWYRRLSDEDKKKEIDRIRKREILDRI